MDLAGQGRRGWGCRWGRHGRAWQPGAGAITQPERVRRGIREVRGGMGGRGARWMRVMLGMGVHAWEMKSVRCAKAVQWGMRSAGWVGGWL